MNSLPSCPSIAQRRSSGFSLVEVVLAVGVISFAFVAILGLLPAGLQQFRQAMDTSVAAQISQRIIQDAQLTDFATLTTLTPTSKTNPGDIIQANSYSSSDKSKSSPIHTRYFDEQGNEIIPATATPSVDELKNAIYHVNTRVVTATLLPGTGGVNYGLATVTVQVAFNPSGRTIPIDPSTKLYDQVSLKKYNVPVKSFSAYVGRND